MVTKSGQVRQALACRAGPGQRKPAKAVRQGLGGPAETLPGPGGLGERPVWVEGDTFACGVDLAGGFPVPGDGGVGQPGVNGRHLVGFVVEDRRTTSCGTSLLIKAVPRVCRHW